jgi:uncharacterized protein YodC (DUF2158 family)
MTPYGSLAGCRAGPLECSANQEANMTDFNPGDVVQLKSGGPLMTVSVVTGPVVVCEWFDDKQQVLVRAFGDAMLAPSNNPPALAQKTDSPPRERKALPPPARRPVKPKEDAAAAVSNGGAPAV